VASALERVLRWGIGGKGIGSPGGCAVVCVLCICQEASASERR